MIGTTTIMQSLQSTLIVIVIAYICNKHDTNTTSNQEQDQEHQEWEIKHAA